MLMPLSTEHQDIVETARSVLSLGTQVPQRGTREVFDPDLWDRLRELGWLGVAAPEEYGGAGATFAEVGLVIEEAGRVLAPVPLVAQISAIAVITAMGSQGQKEALLPDLVVGDRRIALGLHGHVDAVRALAVPDGSVVLTGLTSAVLGATTATMALVSAATEEGAGLFLVDLDSTTAVLPTGGLDLRRDISTVRFDQTPAAALGTASDAAAVDSAVALATIAVACESSGAATRCLERILDHLATREQFGKFIGTFQALKHRCSTLFVETTISTTAARLAASEVTPDLTRLTLAAAVAKLTCTHALRLASKECVQMHGAMGFSWEFDAHLYLRRAKSDEFLFGTSRTQGSKLADELGIASPDGAWAQTRAPQSPDPLLARR